MLASCETASLPIAGTQNRQFGSIEHQSDEEFLRDLPQAHDSESDKMEKQKRILRRYLRLKRNNYIKHHQAELTESYYIDHYLPKLKQVIHDNINRFQHLENVVIASYNPLPFEMNITPVIQSLISSETRLRFTHALPVVTKQSSPLVFRTH